MPKTMKDIENNDRIRLLREAPDLVKSAIKYGWMTYPPNIHTDIFGTPININDDYEVTIKAHTPEVCAKAFALREEGRTLEETAMACGIARGSIAYVISKGHEQYLKIERAKHDAKQQGISCQ